MLTDLLDLVADLLAALWQAIRGAWLVSAPDPEVTTWS